MCVCACVRVCANKCTCRGESEILLSFDTWHPARSRRESQPASQLASSIRWTGLQWTGHPYW